ncbi:MAG: response regulator [Anaerolineae bacterium]|nr:response regulator [Anaerolineae bacterium]
MLREMGSEETILIADGEPLGRETLKALLMFQGYRLEFAHNGPETLTKVIEIEPDLLLLDAMMPGIDGFEICERLRADPRVAEMPIIMVTSLDDDTARLHGLEVGVDDFITRPFDMAQLRARVRTITHLNRQRRLRTLELQSERDRTQAILEALGDGVIVTDMSGVIQYLNPAAVHLTGFHRAEARGKHWRLLQGAETGARLDEILEVVRTGQTWRGEVVSKRKDGAVYDAALTVAPLLASGTTDELIGFVSVLRDITPLKTAERAKDMFVSNVSHELRTPLSVITLIGDNLDKLYDRLNEDRRRKMIQDIQKHSQALDDLISDILALSRIDSRRMSPDQEQFDLAALVRDEADKLMPLVRERSHKLQFSVAKSVQVYGNISQIGQVIRNLLNNAIKYTLNKGRILCECVAFEKEEGQTDSLWPGFEQLPSGCWAAVKVTDNGIGIGEEHLPHLFERFYRVKAQQNIRGTGLGLAITRELVELHQGHIAVASAFGEGSTFAFYLPLIVAEER